MVSATQQPFLVLIQARMGSERFPGKSLYPIAGKPSLLHLLESLLQCCGKEHIRILTSVEKKDDPIEKFCLDSDIGFFRGEEHNVASRFFDVVKNEQPDYFIRVSGDSPLLDYRIVEEVLRTKDELEVDVVTTVSKTPFPKGMNVELLRTELFVSEYQNFSTPSHFEHVTQYFYENPDSFRVHAVNSGIEVHGQLGFTFDTAEDLERLERFFSALDKPHWEYPLAEKCRIYQELFS